MICNVAYYSAAKFTFPIEQPSNKATKFLTFQFMFHLDNPKIDRVMAV